MKSTYDLQYLDPFSLLVVGQNGTLRRVYCPFYVICRFTESGFLQDQRVSVEMVRTITDSIIGYVIRGQVYPHDLFIISFS